MRYALTSLLAFLGTATAAHAQGTQVLTGRVLGDSTTPLAGAVVSVTMAPDRTFKQDTARADGRWRELRPWTSTAQQQLERASNRGRAGRAGQRLSADSIRIRFSRNVPNIYTQVIDQLDSLLLSREQVDSLRAASARYAVTSTALWQALGVVRAEMDDQYDVKRATQLTEDATDAACTSDA